MQNKNRRFRINLKAKFTTTSITLALVLVITLTVLSYFSYRTNMINKYIDSISSIAATAAALIDADTVARYIETGEKDDAYEELYNIFQIIQEKNQLEFLYSYIPDADGLTVFMQGTSPDNEFHYDLGERLLIHEHYSAEDIDFANELFTVPETEKIYVSTSTYGFLVTAFEVLYDSNGNAALVLGADMSMDKINTELGQFLMLVCILAGAIIAIFLPLYLYFLRKSVVDPLQLLVNSAVRFVETGKDEKGSLTSMNVHVNTKDEIEDLAAAFNQMTEDIVNYIKEITNAASERERVETELRVATLIQEGMLPRNFDIGVGRHIDIFATMRAAKDVGGDFYDFFFVDKHRFCFVIGDVSGKGVPAALFMAMAKANIKDLTLQGFPIDEVLHKANNNLCANNEQAMFVTIYAAILNTSSGELVWSNAGHSKAVLWSGKDNSVTEIPDKKGLVAGAMEDVNYPANSTFIEKGDIVYIYTDGVNEAINPATELYGEQRIFDCIKQLKEHDVRLICESVSADVDKHADTEPQFDDITMLAVKFI